MSFPPHLLDELARVFARVALERLLQESAAREPRHADTGVYSDEGQSSESLGVDDEKKHG